MVNENRLTEYDVYDIAENKIGSVESYWLDEDTRRPEFLGVKTGWIMGKTHVLPFEDARVDDERNRIVVPWEKDRVKDAPSYDKHHDLSESDEQRVREYFGIGAGLTEDRPAPGGGETTDSVEMPLEEEELEVGKRRVPGERVRLKKVVRTEHEEVPVDLKREEVHLERVPPGEVQDEAGRGEAFRDDEAVIETEREEPVVQKERKVTGGVRAYKTEETERREVEGETRHEEADVDRDLEPGGRRNT